MNYRPFISAYERTDGSISLRMHKMVRVVTLAGKISTVCFDWAEVQTMQRQLGLTPREFGKAVREVYLVQHRPDAPASNDASRRVLGALAAHVKAKQAS